MSDCEQCKKNTHINEYGCSVCRTKPVLRMMENYVVESPNRMSAPVQDM